MRVINQIKELRLDIACSIYLAPCTESELKDRELCKNISLESMQRLVMALEKDAIFYKGEVMHIKKAWAKENLQSYELDFRSDKQKHLDSLTPFAKLVLVYK